MLQPEPFEVVPPTERTKNWPALIASAVIHALIILLLLFGIPQSDSRSRKLPNSGETMQPIALPELPPTKPAPKTPPKPQPPPPPPLKEQILGPDAKKDVPVPKEAAPIKPEVAPPPPPTQPATEQPKPETPAAAPQQLRIPKPGDYPESKAFLPLAPNTGTAQKFTPPTSEANARVADVNEMGQLGMGSHDPRNWEKSFDTETAGTCVKLPPYGKNADGTPVLASISGTVLDEDGHYPLADAHLVIVGNGASTFSDSKGNFRLDFDPSLLENCRSQQVRVDAPGHEEKMLWLEIGEQRSSVVPLRRHH